MHSEGEIKQFVRILVEKYGELTTSELKEKMSEVVDYDSDDMKLSPTRRGRSCMIPMRSNRSFSDSSANPVREGVPG